MDLPDTRDIPPSRLAAIAFESGFGIDALMAELAHCLKEHGMRLSGAIQTVSDVPGSDRRNLRLRALDDDWEIPILQDRGALATGCRLDYGSMVDVCARIEAGFRRERDLMILNRFGRAEAEGGGLRQVLQRCVEAEVPTLIAVRQDYLADWAAFHGGLAQTLTPDLSAVMSWCLQWQAAEA